MPPGYMGNQWSGTVTDPKCTYLRKRKNKAKQNTKQKTVFQVEQNSTQALATLKKNATKTIIRNFSSQVKFP